MNGENHGKPYEQMDDLGVPLYFWNTHICKSICKYQHLQVGVPYMVPLQGVTSPSLRV